MSIISTTWAATWQNQQSECAPSEDSDQPGHLSSLIRVFAIRMKTWVLSYPLSAQRRLWSDWADPQADLSLHWVHSHFVGFVMLRLLYSKSNPTENYYFTVNSFKQLYIWDASWQNKQNGMGAQRQLRSAWASAQSDQSLRCPHEETLGP